MDTAEEVNDGSTGSRSLRGAAAEEHVSQQDAEAGAGVGLKQEEDGLALVQGLLDAQRCEDTVVDGVVEEEDLGRLDEDAGQGSRPLLTRKPTTAPAPSVKRWTTQDRP